MNGVDLFYETIGRGDPLLLLNGVMMTAASWGLQTRTLSKHFTCVLHDFRGQLKSEKPPGPYSLQVHVDDLVALMDVLGIQRAHVAGTSYGGEVAMLFAAQHPSRVASLAVIASVSEVPPDLRARIDRWVDVARENPDALYDETAPDNFSQRFREEHPEFIEAGRERLRGFDPEWFRALADLCRSFQALDLTPVLSRIECPTLVVAADDDAIKPLQYSRLIAKRIPRAQLATIPNAGHAVVIEQPQAINELLLRFLADVPLNR